MIAGAPGTTPLPLNGISGAPGTPSPTHTHTLCSTILYNMFYCTSSHYKVGESWELFAKISAGGGKEGGGGKGGRRGDIPLGGLL